MTGVMWSACVAGLLRQATHVVSRVRICLRIDAGNGWYLGVQGVGIESVRYVEFIGVSLDLL